MYRLYDENVKTDIYYDCNENICITKAIMDLQKDIGVVGGKDICVNQYLPDKIENNFIIGTLKNKVFANFVKELKIDISHIENKWEKYLIRTIGDNEDTLIIIGSDDRGTMWGIYEFSERFLGIDPLYLWTDYEPVKMDVLEIEKIRKPGDSLQVLPYKSEHEGIKTVLQRRAGRFRIRPEAHSGRRAYTPLRDFLEFPPASDYALFLPGPLLPHVCDLPGPSLH